LLICWFQWKRVCMGCRVLGWGIEFTKCY
jgi:hypothetical protein